MKPSDTARDESLLRRLVENDDESAALALLVELCRQSPPLRSWLWQGFGRDAILRRRFRELVNDASAAPPASFADLADKNGVRRQEMDWLRQQISGRLYGGLTWTEMVKLVRHYQAGQVDLGAFLLAHDWREAGQPTPALMWGGVELLQLVLPSGRRRLLKHLNKALALLKSCDQKAKRRAIFGHADWWKLHTLFFMLRHARESYRTRELRAHLAALGVEVSTKDMRRFCSRHGIRRDMRAGRPRKPTSPPAEPDRATSTAAPIQDRLGCGVTRPLLHRP